MHYVDGIVGDDHMEYIAHYNKRKNIKQTMKDHQLGVAISSANQIPDSVAFKIINSEELKDAAYIMGYFHDIGKYSEYFQEYILKGIDNPLKMHSHISACFVYNMINKRLELNKKDSQGSIFSFLIYLSIRLHHDSLHVDSKLFPRSNSDSMWKNLELIKENILKNKERILNDIGNIIDCEEFIDFFNIDKLKSSTKDFIYIPQLFLQGRIKDEIWYFFLIYIFSILIDNDKLNTAKITPWNVKSIEVYKVEEYIKKKNKEKTISCLIKEREKARRSILDTIDKLSDEEIKDIRFFILNGPTGIGKTLSSLEFALKLKKRIEKIYGYSPRIITAIPFINIIEQNKKEYENVIGKDAKIIVHHRLSDFSKMDEDETKPLDKSLYEVESWDGDVILTTFVQLFHSLLTGNNRSLKKINKLAGSIIILDEAQAIPEDYMPLIGAILQKISEYYGARFVIMTATQPKLLEFGSLLLKNEVPKQIQMLPDYKQYFVNLDRTKFIPMIDKKIDTDEFMDIFLNKWDGKSSALIVVNTIKRSIEIFKRIKDILKQKKSNVAVFYLSTNIIPKSRIDVINRVKNILDSNGTVILVSTQTIEAGVDLDFNMAFRDFAPLDSLIQTAGRVNREGKKGKYLPVYIVLLSSDNQYIYELMNRDATIKLLSAKKEIKENEYFELTQAYYNIALQRCKSCMFEKSKEIWEDGILKLDFEKIEKFHLIDNMALVRDVFVEIDDKASVIADAFEAVLLKKEDMDVYIEKAFGEEKAKSLKTGIDEFERKALLKLISSRMNDYIIQIRISNLIKNRPLEFCDRGGAETELFWIPKTQVEYFYDFETGFISENGAAFIF